ncbi:MAG: hypothetical protein AB1898_29660 [Acidobacteriota bacterium]
MTKPVGAGTVDGSIFRLYTQAENPQLTFYHGVVLKQGAAHLEAIASRQLAQVSMPWFKKVKEEGNGDPDASFPKSEEAKMFLDFASQWIGSRVQKGLSKLLGKAYEKEKVPARWHDLTLLTGGGGAGIPVYLESSRQALSRLATNLTVEKLQKPRDFDMSELPSTLFHRFAVAYGLSFNTVNLPQINLPHEVSPLSLEEVHPFRGIPACPTPDVG